MYRNLFSMGTRLDLVIPGLNDRDLDELLRLVKSRLDQLEDMLSIYRFDSELSVVNRTAAEKRVPVSAELFGYISDAMRYYDCTQGIFDMSMGRLSRIWRGGIKPSEEEITLILDRSGMEKVELSEGDHGVRYHGQEIELDPGGFGKGIAISAIKEILYTKGVPDALVSFGESSLLGLGTHPNGPYWPVAVMNIFNPGDAAKSFRLSGNSLSTSGTGYAAPGHTFRPAGNIVDPRTGHPVTGIRTVSVLSGDPVLAEVLSTTLLVDRGAVDPRVLDPAAEAWQVSYKDQKVAEVVEI